ncbi:MULTISPECIES: peptidyl-prolyl cis-trans isomerase [Bacillaceae]|uniref:peptidyl-prolyl cis-trans isomerase n=1 Tax=Bacillaceae TaxID=186817 RepID=UPI001E4E6B9D|nr:MULTISPECIES: peptidyl-prolyl cis-trans isomerase [Bacillaceae]MCE4048437.1 peptidyl-prolyl cis-trans isomerase [Bacillus sp. Au-Bac7]MDL0435003.1 peptidyl-prolyl cis-trans isomerase [Niallia sp. SS-2023]UPO88809.1 peptidyl-prolyl cis-trans isomerase [Niallia sp. Man26]
MNQIMQVKGLVAFPITIDPSVWIFDDRKKTSEEIFALTQSESDLEAYTKEVSKHWDRELLEGAHLPEKAAGKKFKKQEIITGTFYMPLAPFIKNAEPLKEAEQIVIQSAEKELTYPLSVVDEMVLLFCKNGKPLTDSGPIHLFFKNKGIDQTPLTSITGFELT